MYTKVSSDFAPFLLDTCHRLPPLYPALFFGALEICLLPDSFLYVDHPSRLKFLAMTPAAADNCAAKA